MRLYIVRPEMQNQRLEPMGLAQTRQNPWVDGYRCWLPREEPAGQVFRRV